MNSQVTNQINQVGHLTIGGVDSIDLAREYGTPLVVYDVLRKFLKKNKLIML